MADPIPPDPPSKQPLSPTTVILLIIGAAVVFLLLCVVLGVLLAMVIPAFVRSKSVAQERAGMSHLMNLVAAEGMWRQDDSDKNGKMDYWTADVSGMFRVERPPADSGMPMGLIDDTLARADDVKVAGGAPMAGGDLKTAGKLHSSGLLEMRETVANAGYFVRSLTTDANGDSYAQDPDGDGYPWTNEKHFGFQAHPAAYASGAHSTFVVNEEGVIYAKDLGSGAPGACTAWPGANPQEQGWKLAR